MWAFFFAIWGNLGCTGWGGVFPPVAVDFDFFYKRDFLYIKDVVNLYLQISQSLYLEPKKISGEVFNAGSNRGHKVKDIVKTIFEIGNKKKNLKSIFKNSKFKKTEGEIKSQYMDYKKVNKFFGWKPTYKMDRGLKEAYDWYKKYINKIT